MPRPRGSQSPQRHRRWGRAGATAFQCGVGVAPGLPDRGGLSNRGRPRSARVELLATGAPGRRFALSWEETCGWTQVGSGAVGGTGGQGTEIVRSPAVTLVNLPRIRSGVRSCYLAATASATTFTRHLRLAIIDY